MRVLLDHKLIWRMLGILEWVRLLRGLRKSSCIVSPDSLPGTRGGSMMITVAGCQVNKQRLLCSHEPGKNVTVSVILPSVHRCPQTRKGCCRYPVPHSTSTLGVSLQLKTLSDTASGRQSVSQSVSQDSCFHPSSFLRLLF